MEIRKHPREPEKLREKTEFKIAIIVGIFMIISAIISAQWWLPFIKNEEISGPQLSLQSPTIAESDEAIINYGTMNSITNNISILSDSNYNNYQNILEKNDFVQDTKSEVMSDVFDKFYCNWKLLPHDSKNKYEWICEPRRMAIENTNEFPLKNVKVILPEPDGRELFISSIGLKSSILLGSCIKGKEYPNCVIPDFYLFENYKDEVICFEIKLRWDDEMQSPTFDENDVKMLDCGLYKLK